MGEIVLIRHGQTEWSRDGRHTSRTDLDLTREGERQARTLAPRLAGRGFTAVWSSPLLRARRTAELAGLTVTRLEPGLVEWDYGDYEGVTTAVIRHRRPDWSIWRDGCPGGESPAQIGDRLDRVLAAARPLLAEGDLAFVAHGHTLRVTAARWIGLPASGGALLGLDTASVSVLGFEREQPVLRHWNLG